MARNYLLLALRTHLRSKFYTAVNITGLAVGIAACLIIMLFVRHETSYDTLHEKINRIYRVNTQLRFGAVQKHLSLAAPRLSELFIQTYPEIESYVRIMSWGGEKVHRPEHSGQNWEKMAWADSTLFTVFTFKLIEGDARTALSDPNTVAINHTMAEKYFPEGNAVGKLLIIGDDETSYKVTAVFEDMPSNSHFHVDIFKSNINLDDIKNVSLIGGGWMNTYLLLRKGTNPKDLESKFPQFVEKHVAPQISDIFHGDFTMEKFKSDGNAWSYSLTPLRDIHLLSDLEGELEANSNITYVYLFAAIGLFILSIACINFMNLSTAQSARRAKEVGMRKVMGSFRSHLVRQFLTESFVLSLISFVLAIIIAWVALPLFNDLAQKTIFIPFNNYLFYLAMLAGVLLVSLLAGSYPSFVLSSFKPVDVLKGKLAVGSKSGFIRSTLVVFQFVISIALIIGTIAIQKQLYYVQHKNVGFEKDQVIIIHDTDPLDHRARIFKEEALKNRFITAGTVSSYLPVSGTSRNNNSYWPEGKTPTGNDLNQMVSMQGWDVDGDYLRTLGMKVKAGRSFSSEFPSDSTQSIILNESAVEKLELGPDPVGKKISSFSASNPDGSVDQNSVRSWTVIGIVEDFHFANMRESISPLGLFLQESDNFVAFKFEGSKTAEVLVVLEKLWASFAEGRTFQYSFLDDDYGKMYDSEKRLGNIFALFAGLAIVIACLGLFALASFTVEQRTKEIGIRKSLGASVGSIVLLLSRVYGKLVLIAFVASMPISWYGINKWIEGYSYRTTIGVDGYAFAGSIALLISLITIGYQCLRAARMNPVQSLRSGE
ncbi:MAG TPA: ABC transporter permease [Chryseolinea sp.]|nr:ABC transporter permease [Chryseolinea sp.]